jgi:hypothetical protein
MTKRRKRFLVEFPEGVTDIIVAHPGGHIDVITLDPGDQGGDDELEEGEQPIEAFPSPRRGAGPRCVRKRKP